MPDGISSDNGEATSQTLEQQGGAIPAVVQPSTNIRDYKTTPIDLILFPEAKTVFLGVDYISRSSSYSIDYDGDELLNFKGESDTLTLSSLYGINDKIALGAEISRVFDNSGTTTYGPGSTLDGDKTETNNPGLEDPSFIFIYRFLDVSRDRYDMNIGLTISPSLQSGKYASGSANGNAAKGRDEYTLFIKWGRRDPSFSWALGLNSTSFGKRKMKDAETGEVLKTSSYSTFEIISDFQWKLSKPFSIELNLAYGASGDFTNDYSDGSREEWEHQLYFGFGTTINYQINNSTYIRSKIAGVAGSPADIKTEDGEILTLQEPTEGIFTLGVLFQF